MSSETIHQHKEHRYESIIGPLGGIGSYMSYWLYEGCPGAGAIPTTWTNPTNATPGSLGQTDPSGGAQKLLTSLTTDFCNTDGIYILYDRLLHVGGFSATSTSVQNVNGGSVAPVSRHYVNAAGDTDIGNSLWLEGYVQTGVTTTTVTVSYTNELGVAHTTTAPVSRMLAAQMLPIPLAPGDRGVQSVTSVQLAGTTGTTGNFGVTVAHRLLSIACCFAEPKTYVGAQRGFIECLPGACWAWMGVQDAGQNATLPSIDAFFAFGDK